MKCRTTAKVLLASLTVLSLALSALAEDAPVSDVGTFDKATAEKVFPAKRAYSPWAGRNFPSRPLFGDTHLHTAFSFDAGAFGARLLPSDAYRRKVAETGNFGRPRANRRASPERLSLPSPCRVCPRRTRGRPRQAPAG